MRIDKMIQEATGIVTNRDRVTSDMVYQLKADLEKQAWGFDTRSTKVSKVIRRQLKDSRKVKP